jgi:hypothetical protein
MRITYCISASVTGDSPETWDSTLASVRYRVLQPARTLVHNGHHCRWIRFEQLQQPSQALECSQLLQADIVVISKVLAQGSIVATQQAQEYGTRVVVDLCDDHFDTPELSPTYFKLCQLADAITASTPMMAQVIQERTGRYATVIADPYEGPHGEPNFTPGQSSPALRLAWFGHPVNFDTVLAMLPDLQVLSRERSLDLHLVTDLNAARQTPLMKQLAAASSPGLNIRLSAWSQAATWNALAQCDAVVIPSLPDAKKQVKSPNRVVEGIRAGRLVIAYPLHSYQALAQGCWLGTNLADGLRWALQQPEQARARILAGQQLIEQTHAPRYVGQQWEHTLQAVAECEYVK